MKVTHTLNSTTWATHARVNPKQLVKSMLVVSLGSCALLLSGCNKPADEAAPATTTDAASTTDAPQNIKIATESSYKPFSYTDASGNLIGYEIDLTNALCEQMQAKCEIISQDWDGLIPGLNAKKFDAIIAGMSITPERQKVVDFTDSYFQSGIILIAKKGSNITLDKLAGVPIGAQRSTVSSQYLQDNHSDADIKLYDTQENTYLDLTSGRVQAILVDKVVGLDWLKTDAGMGYEMVGEEISTADDSMGIAFRKGDPLVAKFNAALSELRANGKYDEITNKYFATSSTAAAITGSAAANTASTEQPAETTGEVVTQSASPIDTAASTDDDAVDATAETTVEVIEGEAPKAKAATN